MGAATTADLVASLNEGNKRAVNNPAADAFQAGADLPGAVSLVDVANVTYNAVTNCPDTNSEFTVEIVLASEVPGLQLADYPNGAYPTATFILR